MPTDIVKGEKEKVSFSLFFSFSKLTMKGGERSRGNETMHHPFFEEWRIGQETRRLDVAGRHAWKLGRAEAANDPALVPTGLRSREQVWRLRLRLASLRVCVSFRWGGHPER